MGSEGFLHLVIAENVEAEEDTLEDNRSGKGTERTSDHNCPHLDSARPLDWDRDFYWPLMNFHSNLALATKDRMVQMVHTVPEEAEVLGKTLVEVGNLVDWKVGMMSSMSRRRGVRTSKTNQTCSLGNTYKEWFGRLP